MENSIATIIGADAVSRAPRRSTDGARGATSYILGTRAGLVIAEALVMPLKLDLAPAAKNETEDAA